ncbi:MAG TPA: ACT domain-containing protein [Phycisphaerae bacterium]|nr:ACT domain-containing protein [Phycisphaerae bacterium]
MANHALLTAMGRDRPGIVAAVSGVLYECGCNIEDSTMARLGGDFAIMLMVSLPGGLSCEVLSDRLDRVRVEMNLTLQLTAVSEEEAAARGTEAASYVIHVYGADRKGIVAKVTGHLAARQINIANLTTHIIAHQNPLYVMMIDVVLPRGVDSGQLAEELAGIGRDIGVQITVRPKDDARF